MCDIMEVDITEFRVYYSCPMWMSRSLEILHNEPSLSTINSHHIVFSHRKIPKYDVYERPKLDSGSNKGLVE